LEPQGVRGSEPILDSSRSVFAAPTLAKTSSADSRRFFGLTDGQILLWLRHNLHDALVGDDPIRRAGYPRVGSWQLDPSRISQLDIRSF